MAGLTILGMAIHQMQPCLSQYWQLRSLAAEMRNSDPLISLPAAHALSKAGPPAVPRLIDALHDRDTAVRRRACWVFAEIWPLPLEAISPLGAALRDDDPEVRRRAADALRRFGPKAASQTLALRSALDDPDPNVRFGAARALGEVEGRNSELVVRTMLDLLTVPVILYMPEADRRPGDPVQIAAADLISRMEPQAKGRAVAVLAPLLSAKDQAVRRAAIESLFLLRPSAAPAAPSLEDALQSDDDLVAKCFASLTLAEIEGIEKGRARTTLQELLDSGALQPEAIPPRLLAQVRHVLAAGLVNGSEFRRPIHLLRNVAEELRRAEAQPKPVAGGPLGSNAGFVQPEG
jgi:HEAT repeat protein